MKKLVRVCLILVIALCAAALFLGILVVFLAPRDEVLDALPHWENKEYYTCGGFQDSTDYAKYTYRISRDQLEETGFFQPVTEDDIPRITDYVDNFEEWLRVCEDFPKDAYDFDKSRISVGDCFFILNKYEEAERAFWNYNLYYFDVDVGILYYFHNNI